MGNDYDKTAWISNVTTTKTPWGHESRWSALPSIHGKRLIISKGKRTSLKYHPHKNEAFFIISGEVKVFYADEEWLHYKNTPMKQATLGPGEAFTLMARCVYRIKAVEDSEIIEVANSSTGQPVRIADDYGRTVIDAVLPNDIPE